MYTYMHSPKHTYKQTRCALYLSCTNIRPYTQTHVHTYTLTHSHAYTYTYVQTHTHTHTLHAFFIVREHTHKRNTYTHTHIHTHTHTNIHTHYALSLSCTHANTYIHIHIYVHSLPNPLGGLHDFTYFDLFVSNCRIKLQSAPSASDCHDVVIIPFIFFLVIFYIFCALEAYRRKSHCCSVQKSAVHTILIFHSFLMTISFICSWLEACRRI